MPHLWETANVNNNTAEAKQRELAALIACVSRPGTGECLIPGDRSQD